MPEQQVAPANEVKTENTVIPVKTEDIVSRVAKFKEAEATKPSQTQDDNFDIREIEKISDPMAKEQALRAYKSFQRDYTKKTQEIAEIRKSYEQKMIDNARWTPERVKSLLNDQEFVKSAEAVAGLNQSIQNGEQPQIPEAEKQKIKELDEQMRAILNQNAQLMRQKQHDELKSKYAGYDPQAIDSLANDLLQGKITATPEHLWKVLDYEPAINRAYKLGLEDRKLSTQEKVNSSSVDGISTSITNKEGIKRNDNEHSQDFFKRILTTNLSKVKSAAGG